jgi:cysteine-rich repeat protein
MLDPKDAPSTFQYGDPTATMLTADGRLDAAATLQVLRAERHEQSLQARLLAAGRCVLDRCIAGTVGRTCGVDTDCALSARAFDVTSDRHDGVPTLAAVLADVDRGEACDDGNLTDGDGCDSSCTPTACGNGVTTAGEACDGGLNCSPACTVLCPVVPSLDCRHPAAGKSALALRAGPEVRAPRLAWQWTHGIGTTKADFGRPTADEHYAFCLYDARGLLLTTIVPAGGISDRNRPCWTEQRHGFRYRGCTASRPVTDVTLRADTGNGNARLGVRGRGPRVNVPSGAVLLPPVTAQLRNASGVCWAADYTPPFRVNDGSAFKDAGD